MFSGNAKRIEVQNNVKFNCSQNLNFQRTCSRELRYCCFGNCNILLFLNTVKFPGTYFLETPKKNWLSKKIVKFNSSQELLFQRTVWFPANMFLETENFTVTRKCVYCWSCEEKNFAVPTNLKILLFLQKQ